MRIPIRSPLVLTFLGVALACGNAVTDPALEGFPSDPRVVEGDWVTLHERADGGVDAYAGELVPAGGRMIGSFDFHRYGQPWHVQFNDGTWDGTRVQFTVTMMIAGTRQPVAWAATYFPPEGGEPARLLLSSGPFGGPAVPIEYLRPRDLP